MSFCETAPKPLSLAPYCAPGFGYLWKGVSYFQKSYCQFAIQVEGKFPRISGKQLVK